MPQPDLLKVLKQEQANAENHQQQSAQTRTEAWDYYLQKPYGNEKKNRSQVVTSEVMDSVEWLTPQIVDILIGSQHEIANFIPQGPEDVQAAKQEIEAVKHVFFHMNNGFQQILWAIKDALLVRLGVVRVLWEEREPIKELYEGITPSQMAELEADPKLKVLSKDEIIEIFETDFGDLTEIKYNVEVIEKEPKGVVRLEAVPRDSFFYNEDAKDIESARYVSFKYEKRISELRAMGLDVEDDIIDDHSTDIEDGQRNAKHIDGQASPDHSPGADIDPALRTVSVVESYNRFDADGDGISEIHHVIRVGDTILLDEEVEEMEVAAGTAIPIQNMLEGLSIADLVKSKQLQKSTLLRNIFDNQYQNNFGRWKILA